MTDYSKLTGPQLVSAYNDLVAAAALAGIDKYQPTKRFTNREAGVKRCGDVEASLKLKGALAQSIAAASLAALPKPKPAMPEPGRSPVVQQRESSTKKASTRGGKPAAPERFKPVRAGTVRAEVVELGVPGTKTADEIARKIQSSRRLLMVHLFCLQRDCGMGYSMEGGVVRVVLPEGKTLADAVKSKTESKEG